LLAWLFVVKGLILLRSSCIELHFEQQRHWACCYIVRSSCNDSFKNEGQVGDVWVVCGWNKAICGQPCPVTSIADTSHA
jgi:hypothetical protein